MRDPDEGLTPEGFIKTGVRRDRIPPAFEPVIEAAIQEVERLQNDLQLGAASLYLYGSVATGSAASPFSDVDFLTVGIPLEATEQMAHILSTRFKNICRSVEIATAIHGDFQGDGDESYGGRVFLRHYCLLVYGDKLVRAGQSFSGDRKAARGFNGDIESHYRRWCSEIVEPAPEQLGRRIARKSLLAVAGLVSLHDQTWTTDRRSSALRWAELNPPLRPAINNLIAWSEGDGTASRDEIAEALSPDGIVSAIVEDFRAKIGLWP